MGLSYVGLEVSLCTCLWNRCKRVRLLLKCGALPRSITAFPFCRPCILGQLWRVLLKKIPWLIILLLRFYCVVSIIPHVENWNDHSMKKDCTLTMVFYLWYLCFAFNGVTWVTMGHIIQVRNPHFLITLWSCHPRMEAVQFAGLKLHLIYDVLCSNVNWVVIVARYKWIFIALYEHARPNQPSYRTCTINILIWGISIHKIAASGFKMSMQKLNKTNR